MCAALAGCCDCPQRPFARTTSPRRRLLGPGEALPCFARMYCPPARAFAHPHAARMCALRFCALPALPACVVAVLTLCACVVHRRAMWRKRACKAAGWGCGLQLVRAGTGRSVCVLVQTPLQPMRTLKNMLVSLVPCVPCVQQPFGCIFTVFFKMRLSKSQYRMKIASCMFSMCINEHSYRRASLG